MLAGAPLVYVGPTCIKLLVKDSTGSYMTVPSHVVGVVTEFATALATSFVIANRNYPTEITGLSAGRPGWSARMLPSGSPRRSTRR